MIRLVRTCFGWPEQYDAFDGSERVGYLRLRHGYFSVECPDVGGKTVYEANPNGDGCFNEDERDYYLRFAVDAILRWRRGEHKRPDPPAKRPDPPAIEYKVAYKIANYKIAYKIAN